MNRIRRVLRRHGVVGCLILALRSSAKWLLTAVYQHERHVWYAAEPTAVTARSLPKGLELHRSGRRHLDLLSESNLCGWTTGETFLAEGGDLWIVREGERAAFCCWIFRERVPTVAARCGWKGLPAKTVCLEDPVTGPGYRGRGIAPAAWFLIAQSLKSEDIQTIIIKVEEDNMTMRRAVLSAGLHEVAVMDYLNVGGLSRVRVVPVDEINERDREILREMQNIAA